MNIEFSVRSGDKAGRISRPGAANILVVGNFAGQEAPAKAGAPSGPIRNMFSLDPLELDAAMQRIGPKTSVDLGEQTMPLSFESIDDFHPDTILRNVPLFSMAAGLRKSLDDPAKSAAAASLVRELLDLPETSPGRDEPATTEPEAAPAAESSGDLFSRLLGQDVSSGESKNPVVRSALDKLLAEAVDENRAPPADAGTEGLKAELDAWISAALRELLQHADFRSVETAWRSLAWLGERINFDETATLWLVDVDVTNVKTWADALPRHVAAGPGSAGMLVVLHEFSDSTESLEQLQALATVSATLSARAFAAASRQLAGLQGSMDSAIALDGSDFNDAPSKQWSEICAGGSAAHVGLGFPGLLLRHPYGRRSDPIDTFDFDELGVAPGHEAFTWGNPAVALAAMSLDDSLVVDDCPLVTFDDGSGQAIKSPTGAYLTDSAADKLLARGIIPLLAERGGTDVRVPRLQSIAVTAL